MLCTFRILIFEVHFCQRWLCNDDALRLNFMYCLYEIVTNCPGVSYQTLCSGWVLEGSLMFTKALGSTSAFLTRYWEDFVKQNLSGDVNSLQRRYRCLPTKDNDTHSFKLPSGSFKLPSVAELKSRMLLVELFIWVWYIIFEWIWNTFEYSIQ